MRVSFVLAFASDVVCAGGFGLGAVTTPSERVMGVSDGAPGDPLPDATGVSSPATAVFPGLEITRSASGFLLRAHAGATTHRETRRTTARRKRMVAIMRRMPETRHRLSDKQALGALGAYLVFRAVTQRLGFAFGPQLLKSAPWAIPLLNNSMLLLIQTGVGTRGRPFSIVAAGAASVLLSLVAGLVLYWAGHRFGDKLAEMAARPGSPWAGVWNPKQIARAERWIDGWGLPVVFFGKVIEYFTVPVVLVAGATRMAIRRFLVAYTLGSIAFAALGLWIGGAAGKRWPWLDDWIANVYGPWALRIGLGLIVVLVIVSLLARRKTPAAQPAEETTDDGHVELEQAQPEAATTTPSQGSSENEPPTS